MAPWFHELGRDNIKTASELHKVVAKVLLLVVLGQLGAPFLFLLVVQHVRETIGTRIYNLCARIHMLVRLHYSAIKMWRKIRCTCNKVICEKG